jgi:capsid portal protein
MKLFGFNFFSKPEPTPVPLPESRSDSTLVDSFSFYQANTYLPAVSTYYTTNTYVKWGNDNLFPLQLVDLYNSSPIHSSIILQKSKMVVGAGLNFNDSLLSVQQKDALNRFLVLADGEKDLETVLQDLSFDYQLFGAMALEVMWNMDFTKIVKVNRIPVMNIRLGKENERGCIEEFYFNKDWSRSNRYTIIPAFNILNRSSQNQIIYIKNPSADGRYYGVPTYASGLNWVAADASISKFHLSNINQGFAPSIAIKFYKKPESEEQRDEIVRGIKKEYSGQGNAGKAMIFFSDGKDLAPDVAPVATADLDKQFTVIADQIVDQIIRSHRGVSPILWGVKTAGQLGGASGEYEVAYKTFEKNVVQPDRKVLENLINRILKINGWNVNLTMKPFQVFDSPSTINQ